jgi:hypothetical protein
MAQCTLVVSVMGTTINTHQGMNVSVLRQLMRL